VFAIVNAAWVWNVSGGVGGRVRKLPIAWLLGEILVVASRACMRTGRVGSEATILWLRCDGGVGTTG
jgi:hypothetical protein